ncbi:MAP kinase kinase kinase wis4 [Exophiala dermatitidis]
MPNSSSLPASGIGNSHVHGTASLSQPQSREPLQPHVPVPLAPASAAALEPQSLPTSTTKVVPLQAQTQIAAPSPVRPSPSRLGPRAPKSEEQRREEGRLPLVMEHEEMPNHRPSGGSSSGSDEDNTPSATYVYPSSSGYDSPEGAITYTPTSSVSAYTPSAGFSSGPSSWNSYGPRPRGGSGGSQPASMDRTFSTDPTATQSEVRSARPGAPLRTPSNTYAPPRRPPQFLSINSKRMHSSTQSRSSRRDPNAQYKAQEKAYVQRVRQQPQDWLEGDPRTPSIGYSTDDETDDESPSTEHQFDDPYDPETLMFLGHEDNFQPSEEELQNPQNRERLEWHSMLASVLKGDVVKQEKQRLIGTTEQMSRSEIGSEIWIGARAKYYGRPLQMQRKLIEEGRAGLGPIIESLIAFEIKGETVVGKSPLEQVQEAVANIEKVEWLYSSRRELEAAQPRAASDAFRESCDAIVSWHNITQLINTELAVLQAWVGNPELDFTKQKRRSSDHGDLSDDSSFIDRILKEDGLKSLQGDKSMFNGIGEVITKAKSTLIENAEAFAARHLPPYIEELLTLINFPSRLIQEIIRMRLSYARKMKESAQQSVMIIDQMIAQFQILMNLACLIKRQYLAISHPEPGWDLPPCIDENFDSVIVEALKFYFKMLNWKLGANKNTFREAEILEQEWGFSNEIGRQLEGGDIEVAEQFSSLTAKSLLRLTASFERELRSKPEESPQEMEKRYKTILDSVRVRQRKLFRFSRILRQRFENATEFNLSMDAEQMREFTESLILSGHFLVEMGANSPKGVQFVASPSLWNRPKEIQSILGTSFHADDAPEDPSNPYILIIRPEDEMPWEGPRMDVNVLELPNDVRLGRLRLVADGSSLRLQGARMEFANAVGRELDVVIEQRANLSRVNLELGKIKKTTFKLSNTIMESVEVIRSQNGGIASPELVQSCFAFATEFGKRSLTYMDPNRRMMNNLKLTRLALDWVSFICDDCDAADRRTFKWAVVALEFAMAMTRGRNILDIGEEDYKRIRVKVAGCMSVLISHFDIMGARSTLAAQQEKSRMEALSGMNKRLDFNKLRNDEDCRREMSEQRLAQLNALDQAREERGTSKTTLGRVLEGSNEADRSLTFLSSSATNITMRWQQGQFVGGGTFGSVYAALNLDTGTLMAVKEIRLQDPQLIPTIVKQIGDEMGVLAVLDHPNIVSYYGIEVHRDKVYIFMEYCSGGSVAGLLEHGRIEDETVIMVYALQMLEGLAYLHQAHIVHRDIKPENVLLDHNGVIKYVDFGAAKIIARQGQTMMGQEPVQRVNGEAGHLANNAAVARQPQKTMTGTPMYMSPEVIRGDSTATSRFSGAADIWSLGCVILEMATGRRPWSTLDNEWAIMYNIAQGNPPQLPTEDQLSPMGIDFLKKCFERDPAKRSTAAELLQHPWIVEIRRLVVDDPDAQTPRSDTSTSSGGAPLPFRQNSASS